jgi:hypothetical protein
MPNANASYIQCSIIKKLKIICYLQMCSNNMLHKYHNQRSLEKFSILTCETQ